MSYLTNPKINYCISGSKEKIFNISFESENTVSVTNTYIADMNSNENMNSNEKGNKGNFYIKKDTKATSFVVHSLYNAKDSCFKSTATKKNASTNTVIADSTNFAEIYSPEVKDEGIIGAAALGGNSYILTELTTKAPAILKTFYNKDADKLYTVNLTSNSLNTYLYTPVNELKIEDAVTDSKTNFKTYNEYLNSLYNSPADVVSNLFIPKYNLSGINYNYLIEVPMTMPLYNDYDSGNIKGNPIIAKNEYNSLYSMDTAVDNGINTLSVNNCRKYYSIGTCGDETFLTYLDNVNYKVNSVIDETSTTGVSACQTSILTSDPTYYKVEVLKKFPPRQYHKSNLFSILINNSGLGDESHNLSPDMREKIKQDITNRVKALTKLVAPVHTLLFSVKFNN